MKSSYWALNLVLFMKKFLTHYTVELSALYCTGMCTPCTHRGVAVRGWSRSFYRKDDSCDSTLAIYMNYLSMAPSLTENTPRPDVPCPPVKPSTQTSLHHPLHTFVH